MSRLRPSSLCVVALCYAAPVFAQVTALVIPDSGAVSVFPGARSQVFYVRNTGTSSASYTLTATCTGAVSSCTPNPAAASIDDGRTFTVVVGYTAGATGSGVIVLKALSGGIVKDSG